MKAIIPAAGYATRLWPLTKETPKHLLEVKDKPIISHVIGKICELRDVDEIYIVTNGKFYPVFAEWLDGFSCRIPVRLLNDHTSSNDDRLGQIGDINLTLDHFKVDDDLIVVAGDNLFNFSLSNVYQLFMRKRSVVNALYDVKSIEFARHLGTVIVNSNGTFKEFQEKVPEPKSTLASMGIYFFPREKLGLLKDYLDEGNSPDKMGFFLSWLIAKEQVFGHTYTEKWFDIGWKESLEEARKEFEG